MAIHHRTTHHAHPLCAIWVALALTPFGLMLGFVSMLIVASLLGVPVVTASGDALVSGARSAAYNDTVMVFTSGTIAAFAPPLTALALALRAHRAGYRHAGFAAVVATLTVSFVLGLTLVWNPLMTLAPHT
jgi:hypothetical protein